MKRMKLLCFLLSIAMVATPSMSAMATKDVSVQTSTESTVEEQVVGGYVPLAEKYAPDVVTTVSDFVDEKGGETLDRAGASTSHVPIGDDFMPEKFQDQGKYNTCWAISAITACEINARKKGLDFDDMSSSHLAYYFYNLDANVSDPLGNEKGDYARMSDTTADWTMYGGNGRLSMWQLASWMGVAGYKDSSSPYSYSNLSNTMTLDNTTKSVYQDDTVHVQNVYLSGVSEEYRENAKKLISEQGAVTAGYYTDVEYDSFYKGHTYDDGYTTSYGSYYYDGTGSKSPNHAIVLVGWDDNYSKSNFVTEPTNDGAWLALNSWGDEDTTLAQNGYFWISYEDAGLLSENVVIGYDVESNENYTNVYQYDGSFGVNMATGTDFVQFFTIGGDGEYISAASIGVADTDIGYTAEVYAFDGPISSEDVSSASSWFYDVVGGSSYDNGEREIECSKVSEYSGVFSYDGYHTVNFPSLPTVNKGTTVAVLFKFERPTMVYVDKAYTESGMWDFVTGDDAYRGVVGNGSTCSTMNSGDTLRIKLFTDKDAADSSVKFNLNEEELEVDVKDSTKALTYTLEGISKSDCYVEFEVSNSEYLAVGKSSGIIYPEKVGGPSYVYAYLYDFESGSMIASDYCKVYITSALEAVVMGICPSTLSLGESYKIPYRLVPETATLGDKKIEWISDNPSAVTVDENGKVTAVGYGEATIKCSVQGLAALGLGHRITVSPSFTGVKLNKETANIKKGDSTLLEAMILPIDSKDIVDFQWSSSNENVAKVDENGKVTGVGYGEATITVTCGEFKDTCVVAVGGQLTGVELNKDTAAILKDRSVQLVAQALPVDTTDAVSFTWSSANERIAKVDENGKVTGVGYGTTTIKVTCGSYSDTCKVIVAGQLAAIVLNKESLVLAKEKTSTLVATLEPEELAEDQVITWSSSNGNVATVDKNGKVTAVADGKCTITVTCGDFKDTCEVIVDSIKIYRGDTFVSNLYMPIGSSTVLNAKWGLQEETPTVTWKSNNTNIAKVDGDGKVTGVSAGKTTVYATAMNGAFVGAVSVTITGDGTGDEGEKVSVSVTNKKTEMEVGQKHTIKVSYTPVELNSVNFTYKSSDSSVASIDGAGIITARKAGTTTITVTLECEKGKGTYSYLLTVKEKTPGEPGSGDSGNGNENGGNSDNDGNEESTSDYKLVVNNMDVVKKVSVNGKTKLDVSVKDISGNTVSDAQIAYSADEEYLTIDENDNLVGLKAGTGTVTVVAIIGNQTVTKRFYVSVVLGDNGYGGATEEGSEDNKVEDGKPSGSDEGMKDKLDDALQNKPSTDDKGNTGNKGVTDTTPKKVGVEQIILKASTRQISCKGKLQIKASVKPSSAENKEVKWYTSNKRYATVTQSGLVKAKKAGAGHSVIISCKATDDSGVVASYFVKITEDRVSKIKLSTTQKVKKKVKTESGKKVTKKVKKTFTKKVSVKAGKSFKLKADVKTTGDDVNKKLVWSSSNEDWATVTSKGKVKTKKAGKGHTVTITVRTIDESKKATFKVKIK